MISADDAFMLIIVAALAGLLVGKSCGAESGRNEVRSAWCHVKTCEHGKPKWIDDGCVCSSGMAR